MSPTVTICVASFNTPAATELCVRSMRRFADYPYSLRVGDSGSSYGSVSILAEFEQRGWLSLERSAEPRRHADWLDHWRRTCDSDLLLIVDSDVEFRRRAWLRRMVAAVLRERPAITYSEWLPAGLYTSDGHRARVLARPAPWLLMIDPKQTSELRSSFGVTWSDTDPAFRSAVIRDVGGAFFEEAVQRGLPTFALPLSYRRFYHHYGGLSWLPTTGSIGRRKFRDQRTVARRLRRLQRLQGRSSAPSRLVATAQLGALAQDILDLSFRARARIARGLQPRQDP